MRRIPLKATVYAVLCAMGVVCLSGCVQPVDLVAFAQGAGAWRDENNPLHIIPGGDTTIKEGFNTITMLDPGKYYMVEEWKDNFDPTDFQFVSSGGVRSTIAGVGKVSGATITGLNNKYHYRVRAAQPLAVNVNYIEYPTTDSGFETPEGGVIDLPRPTGTYSYTYSLTPQLPHPLTEYSVAEIFADGSPSNLSRDGSGNINTTIFKDTVVDYVFFRDDGSILDTTTPATYEFYFLRIGTPIPVGKVFVMFFMNDTTTDIYDTRYVTPGSSITGDSQLMPADPERAGHTFDGWYEGNGIGGIWGDAFTGATIVTGSAKSVFAKWVWAGPTVTVTFKHMNGTPPSPDTVRTINQGSTATPPIVNYPGHTLVGWYDRDGTDDNDWGNLVPSSTTFNADMTLYAKWEAVADYTVTFNSWNYTTSTNVTVATATVTPTTAIGAANVPGTQTQTGYTFLGWYTLDGHVSGVWGTQVTGATIPTGDMNAYAQWRPNYTVTFNYNDEGATPPVTLTCNSSGVIITTDWPADPNRTGYNFVGWFTVAGTGGTEVTAATVFTANTDVYARWQEVSTGGTKVGEVTFALPPDEATVVSLGTFSISHETLLADTGNTYTLNVNLGGLTGVTSTQIVVGTSTLTANSITIGYGGTPNLDNLLFNGNTFAITIVVTKGGVKYSNVIMVSIVP